MHSGDYETAARLAFLCALVVGGVEGLMDALYYGNMNYEIRQMRKRGEL